MTIMTPEPLFTERIGRNIRRRNDRFDFSSRSRSDTLHSPDLKISQHVNTKPNETIP